MIVYWRRLNIDWFLPWMINRAVEKVFDNTVLVDNLFKPSPLYARLKARG